MNKFHFKSTWMLLLCAIPLYADRMAHDPYVITKDLFANAGIVLMKEGDYELAMAVGETTAGERMVSADGNWELFPGYFGGGRLGGGTGIQVLRVRVGPNARLFYQESLQVGVPLAAPIVIDFSEQMEVAGMSTGIQVTRLRDHEGRPVKEPIALQTPILDTTLQQVTLTPLEDWRGNSLYEIVINGQVLSLEGYTVDTETHVYFQTALHPAENNVLQYPLLSGAGLGGAAATSEVMAMTIPTSSLSDFAAVLSTRDPVTSPLRVDPATIAEANRKARAASEYRIPLGLREITAYNMQGLPMNTLSRPMVVTLGANLANGRAASGQTIIRPNTLSLWALDEEHKLWVKIPASRVSPDGTAVSASVSNLSVFAVMGSASNVTSDVFVFPNPWRPHGPNAGTDPGQTGTDASGITFASLPSECRIRIFTLAGELVRDIHHSDLTGTPYRETWDGRTSGGDPVASGVYFWNVDSDNEHKSGKLMVIR